VIDLAPRAADQLDIGRRGVVAVEVKPITLPLPDGTVALGAGAAEASSDQVRRALEVSEELMAPAAETAER
jgi:rare lipoprotein A (peptidoglycan hydrolase)